MGEKNYTEKKATTETVNTVGAPRSNTFRSIRSQTYYMILNFRDLRVYWCLGSLHGTH